MLDGKKQEAPWPIPAFHIKVTIGSIGEIAFQEVFGLNTEHDKIEYRAENSAGFSTGKMPGLNKHAEITLKKGMYKDDGVLFAYFASVKMNTVARETVTIQLLDEAHKPLFAWTLKNAVPKKITGVSLNATDNEVAIEEMVLMHDGLTMHQTT